MKLKLPDAVANIRAKGILGTPVTAEEIERIRGMAGELPAGLKQQAQDAIRRANITKQLHQPAPPPQ